MPDLPILLLAAGQSRRMRGADKLMQEVEGMPLLRRAARIARQASDRVLVTLPPAPHPRHAALAGLDVVAIPVPDAAEGMNAGLRRALAALPDQVPGAMVLLADLPDLRASDLKKMIEAFENRGENLILRGATQGGQPGHPVLFDRALFGELAALCGDGGARSVVAAHRHRLRLVRLPGQRARTDLDTPEAWAAWRAANG